MSLPHTLRCLGRPALLGADGAPIHMKSRKQLAVLIYLATDGREAVRRDYLADLLWPGVPEQKARHSLGVALTGLRHRVDPRGFPADHTHVRMTAELEVDLDRLDRDEVLATDLLPALELDAFLEDFEIDDAPGFNHWREGQRARLWPFIEAALVRQMDHCRRTGDFVAIEQLAARLQAHNALSEPAVRARIEARAFAGDRIGALQAYESWRQSLHHLLGAEPSAEITAMARRLRRGTREGGGDGNRLRVPAEQWRDRPFIGRAVEYRALYEAWERTTQGEPWHALVLGESGIGKSTLIQRLLTAASLEGAVTSRVQCYELERGIPYAAIGVLVRGLLERPEALATSPESLADLAQAVPAVHDHFRTLPTPLQLTGESFRIRITDAMEALLQSIAEEVPVILVVDDFHLADDASASVIHLLARRFEKERVMLALAVRPTIQQESPNIARLRESHQRLGFLSLEVPPMADDEAVAMLEALTADGPAPGKTVRDAMLRAAGGYPMALELFVSEWIASGEESLALAVPAMREDLGHRPPPEDAYRMALERIIDGLDAPTRGVLQLAAVLGPRLNELGLYRIIDLGLGSVGEAMTTLRTMRLLRETEERLEFVNELIRGHTYLRIPGPLRTALHGEVVGRLLEAEQNDQHVPGLEIAWHLIRAGRFDEAIPYLLRGARESMRGGAAHEAERGLATAMDRLKEPDKSEALLLLAEALQEQGRFVESIDRLESTGPMSDGLLGSRTRVLLLRARLQGTNVSAIQGAALIAELLEEATHTRHANTRLRALWVAAASYKDFRDPITLDRIWTMLAGQSEADLSLEDRAELALGKAFVHYHRGDGESSLRVIEGIVDELDRNGIGNSVFMRLIVGLAVNTASLGDYNRAIYLGERALAAAKKLGAEKTYYEVVVNKAMYLLRLAKPDEQLRLTEYCALAKYEGKSDPFHQCQLFYVKANALAVLGRRAEALNALDECDASYRSDLLPYLRQSWALQRADIHWLADDKRQALRLAEEGTTGQLHCLLADCFAGLYGRWTARLAGEGLTDISVGHAELVALSARSTQFQYLDRIELLAAKLWLENKMGLGTDQASTDLWTALAGAPAGIVQELRRMDFI